MFKKATLASAAAVIGAATAFVLAPMSAPADTITVCPPGATNPTYCTTKKVCVVPKVVGMKYRDAKALLRKHDCKPGKIKKHEIYKRGQLPGRTPAEVKQKMKDDTIEQGWEKGVVVKQRRKPGKVLPAGTKIKMKVEF